MADNAQTISEPIRVWGKEVDGQSLSIATSNSVYSPGEPIILNILFQNVGEKEIQVARRAPLAIYDVTVILSNRYPVSVTSYGKKRIENADESSVHGTWLKPGEVFSDQILLSKIYDFSTNGNYTISIRRKIGYIFNDLNPKYLVSNEISITINNNKK